jgi:hypothetical protein
MTQKMIDYTRFDTDFEHQALVEAYRSLCPLINCWYPTSTLIGMEKLSNDVPKNIRTATENPISSDTGIPDIPDVENKFEYP